MKNESKIHIDKCEYWGTYDGYDVYKCYDMTIPMENYVNIVFALGNKLFMNCKFVGNVDKEGRISNWAPDKVVKKEEPKADNKMVENSKNVDKILSDSWKRSIEDLVGERFSVEYKYSE